MGNVFKTFKIRGGAIARLQIAIVLLACIITGNKVYAVDVYEFNYTGSVQTWTADKSGKYKIELYGAAGGYQTDSQQIGYGGKTIGYLNIYSGDTLYIAVGGEGTQSLPGELGGAGWNGGGNGYSGSWGGGGATSITTNLRGDGTISNYKDHQNEIVAVAGGGGGAGTNQANADDMYYTNFVGQCVGESGESVNGRFGEGIFVMSSSNKHGYSFGIGQDAYKVQSNGGFGGGAGGGVYGGFAQSDGKIGGGGGSGCNYKLYDYESRKNGAFTQGKAIITYVGTVESHILVDVGNGGTFNGQSGTIDYKQTTGESFSLVDPVANAGYTFVGWQKISNDVATDIHSPQTSGNVIFENDTVTYRAIWRAPLIINATQVPDFRLMITLNQDDMYNKYYRIMEQYDNGSTWKFISATDQGFESPTANRQFGYNGGVQQFDADVGYYTFTCTGASGNAIGGYKVGYGGQSKGSYFNSVRSQIYVTIGGTQSGRQGGYNGGGNGGAGKYNNISGWCGDGTGGGGASNIALTNLGTLNNYQQSREQLLLAAGGGGGVCGGTKSGFEQAFASGGGGGNEGAPFGNASGGTQTSGGNYGGQFGRGGTGADGITNQGQASEGNGGGGGGYFGGGGGPYGGDQSGAGGSGYVNKNLLTQTQNQQAGRGTSRHNGSAQYKYQDSRQTMPQLTNVKYYDRAAPNIPADKGLQYVGSKIQINWMHQEDNGQDVLYKAVQYDADTGTELSSSDTVKVNATQGVHHYKYILDSNPSSTINTNNSNGTAISDTKLQIDGQQSVRYFHVAAVDGAGNIGPTLHIMIPSQIQVTYDKNSTEATGVTDPSHIEYGQVGKIQYSNFKWEGHRFVEWNTKPDGTGEVFKENQDAEYFYIVKKYGYGLTLYAQYETLYSLTVDPNKGEWTDVSPGGDIHVRNDLTSPGIDTSATGKTYKDPVSFIMGLGDRKNIFDAIRTGYNFTGWLFNT